MKFVTKAQWGASARTATPQSHPIGATRGVKLHWGGNGIGRISHDRCAAILRSWERHHEDGRGWADIAYNLAACRHGYVFECRGPWVRSAANGSASLNDDHYAVVYVGGVGDGFTWRGKRAFKDAVRLLRENGGAGPEVKGHRDGRQTTCPGDEIYNWLNRVDWTRLGRGGSTMVFGKADRQTLAEIKAEVIDTGNDLDKLRAGQVRRAKRLRQVLKEWFGATDEQLDRIEAEIEGDPDPKA